jgi:hypothetical protein
MKNLKVYFRKNIELKPFNLFFESKLKKGFALT